LSLLLMRPELDQWQPGEHTGTFRGNNLAFVAATQALTYWDNSDFQKAIVYKGELIETELRKFAEKYESENIEIRGVGMAWGMDFHEEGRADEISAAAFERGLIIETAGADASVLKFLPPLIIEEELLKEGLEIVDKAIGDIVERRAQMRSGGFQ